MSNKTIDNLTDFFDLCEKMFEHLESHPDWKVRPLNRKSSKVIIKTMFNNLNLDNQIKKIIYKKFLKNEVNWIEFYGRCKNLSNSNDVLECINQKSVFHDMRKPVNTLKNLNGFMKPICCNSIRDWRHNCQKISDLNDHKELNVYDYWALFCVKLPKDTYTLAEARIASEDLYNKLVPHTISLNHKL